MSYNDKIQKYKDEALETYTRGLMETVVKRHRVSLNDDGIQKVIEREIADELIHWIPDKYTEVDVQAIIGSKYTSIITEFMEDGKTMLVVIHEEVNPVDKKPITHWAEGYDPHSLEEVFTNPKNTKCRGSNVETLPTFNRLSNDEFKRLYEGQWDVDKLPSPTNVGAAAITKEPKPVVDFTKISSLATPKNDIVPRHSSGMWVGIDLAKVDVKEERLSMMAKETTKEIDNQILKDIMAAAEAIDDAPLHQWAIPTNGWSADYTNWAVGDKPSEYEYTTSNKTTEWTVRPELTWYNPLRTSMEEISFTEDELDELIELLDDNKSRVMEFA